MTLNYFYDKKCSVYSIAKSKVDGSEKIIETAIYTGIVCDFWLWNWNSSDDKLWRETKELFYTVDLQPAYTDIRRWHRIELIDVINGTDISLWMFEVVSVEYFKNINNNLDNIRLKVYPRNI